MDDTDDGDMLPITIQERQFYYQKRYHEGHVLSANEASALDGLLGENLRNNFAGMLKKRAEAQNEDPELPTLTQEDFSQYAESYNFGSRMPRGRVQQDQVGLEERKLAQMALLSKIKEKGLVRPDKEELSALVGRAVATGNFRSAAERIVEVRKAASAELDDQFELASLESEEAV